jgi:uncharacterized lipoprotein YmbA
MSLEPTPRDRATRVVSDWWSTVDRFTDCPQSGALIEAIWKAQIENANIELEAKREAQAKLARLTDAIAEFIAATRQVLEGTARSASRDISTVTTLRLRDAEDVMEPVSEEDGGHGA